MDFSSSDMEMQFSEKQLLLPTALSHSPIWWPSIGLSAGPLAAWGDERAGKQTAWEKYI